MTANDDYIVEILKDVGMLKSEQIEVAKAAAVGREQSALDMLIEQGVVSKMEVLKAVAMQLGMDVITLNDHEIPPEVIQQVPASIARRYQVVPVFNSENTLSVALSDPLNIEILDSLRYLLKRNVDGVVATNEEISEALNKYYGLAEKTMEEIFDQNQGDATDVQVRMDDTADETVATDADAPIIKLVSLIIMEAQRSRASDIHVEPLEKRFRIRYRIDGELREIEPPPKHLQTVMLSRIKLMAHMKLSEKRLPQVGRIQINVGGEDLDLRVSTVPSYHGESIVMRILNKQSLVLGLPKLGLFADDQQVFENLISLPEGLILLTGPTGSGKTTTLYACLNQLNRPDRKIITVEEPVEYLISGINQVQVRDDIGLTFPVVLKAIMRQAPNIIMVGEIRDFPTAEIAIEASLTGHLVFSTLHTNDAPSAIPRLMDMRIKPFLLASSIRAAIAQRLVRVICSKCAAPYTPNERELIMLGRDAAQLKDVKLLAGKGCPACGQTGFLGRKGVYSIFVINDEVREMIYERTPLVELRARARQLGMRTLREDGLRKVVSGMTTLAELFGATMGD